MSHNAMLFDHVNHTSVVDSILEQVEMLILSGVLRDGVRLPSERDLAEQMNVSRPKIREALKRLEDSGLIQVRHGEGTFIAPLIGAAMSPALIQLHTRHASAFMDYLEFREEQEAFASRLAARRATVHDKEILTGLIERLKKAHEDDDAYASDKADLAFHAAIVDASHNSLLVHTMSSIYELSKQNVFFNRTLLRSVKGTSETLLQQHCAIYDAIMNADENEAAHAAAKHIIFVRNTYEAGRAQERREKLSETRKELLVSTSDS